MPLPRTATVLTRDARVRQALLYKRSSMTVARQVAIILKHSKRLADTVD